VGKLDRGVLVVYLGIQSSKFIPGMPEKSVN